MIIIAGSHLELRVKLAAALKDCIGDKDKSKGDLQRTDLPSLVRFVHQDLRYRVLDDWPSEHLANNEKYMLFNSHLPQSPIFIMCEKEDHGPIQFVEDVIVPSFGCFRVGDLPTFVPRILAALEIELSRGKLFEEFPCSGNLDEGSVMLVGEACQEIAPGVKRRAFVSHKGCSLFLCEALRRNAEKHDALYYLTNAQATGNASYDRLKLQREIELIKPSKIIALGVEAAAMLSDLRVEFGRTWHPQYWARFRSDKMDELCEILKP